MEYNVLYLSFILFILSMLVFFVNKNLIIVLMSIELMLNSVNMMLLSLVKIRPSALPPVSVILIFGIIAAEAAIGLAIVILVSRKLKTLNIDEISQIKENTNAN